MVKVLGKNEINRVVKLDVRDKVRIVSIISENIVFVRQASDLDILTVTKIFKHSRKSKKLEMFPEVGDLALTEIDSEICRVLVLRVPDIENEEILVQLIDYGNTAHVKFEDLLEMNSQVQAIPCTALKVNLDVNIPAINCNVIDYLCGLRDRKVELTVSQVSGTSVQLKDGLATSVNETIVDYAEIPEANGNCDEIDYNVSSSFRLNFRVFPKSRIRRPLLFILRCIVIFAMFSSKLKHLIIFFDTDEFSLEKLRKTIKNSKRPKKNRTFNCFTSEILRNFDKMGRFKLIKL